MLRANLDDLNNDDSPDELAVIETSPSRPANPPKSNKSDLPRKPSCLKRHRPLEKTSKDATPAVPKIRRSVSFADTQSPPAKALKQTTLQSPHVPKPPDASACPSTHSHVSSRGPCRLCLSTDGFLGSERWVTAHRSIDPCIGLKRIIYCLDVNWQGARRRQAVVKRYCSVDLLLVCSDLSFACCSTGTELVEHKLFSRSSAVSTSTSACSDSSFACCSTGTELSEHKLLSRSSAVSISMSGSLGDSLHSLDAALKSKLVVPPSKSLDASGAAQSSAAQTPMSPRTAPSLPSTSNPCRDPSVTSSSSDETHTKASSMQQSASSEPLGLPRAKRMLDDCTPIHAPFLRALVDLGPYRTTKLGSLLTHPEPTRLLAVAMLARVERLAAHVEKGIPQGFNNRPTRMELSLDLAKAAPDRLTDFVQSAESSSSTTWPSQPGDVDSAPPGPTSSSLKASNPQKPQPKTPQQVPVNDQAGAAVSFVSSPVARRGMMEPPDQAASLAPPTPAKGPVLGSFPPDLSSDESSWNGLSSGSDSEPETPVHSEPRKLFEEPDPDHCEKRGGYRL